MILFAGAVFSGLLLFFASPGVAGTGLLAWAALVPLLWSCSRTTPRRAFSLGLIGGLVFYASLLYWILIVLGRYGGLSWWISIPALLLLALYMALYLALFCSASRWLQSTVPLTVSAPLLWVALDLVRSKLFSGFPWQDLAYSQYLLPMPLQTVDLAGHHGLTFLIVLTNVLLLESMRVLSRRQSRPIPGPSATAGLLLGGWLLIAAALGYGAWRHQQVKAVLPELATTGVAVVQGNIPQDQKWTAGFRDKTMDIYQELSRQALADRDLSLVIWPETAVPFYLTDTRALSRIGELTQEHQVHLLTGAPHREEAAGKLFYYNSAFLISPDGQVAGKYNKQHLVPFGEYIPLRNLLSFVDPLVETLGDFTPGTSFGPIACQNSRIGVLICFESIFPELARKQAAAGANLLVNLTNDAWFGRSSAPWQHLSMAVLRAVENRRTLVRAANTGISGFIDPLGRLTNPTELFTPAFRVGRASLWSEKTIFMRFGYSFPWVCLVLSILLTVLAFAASRRSSGKQT